ncbi:hypothetical protein MiSe_04400 [Microseira wollei NIES-4236]|uniref:Uncharacterized protein n=1 Tax=Microseira wollei NIES-4236 TaxID=2530354 RepID=A0AAV3X341_9CYAN|nr:hypothetical protein MiSe_04400 [Microseira wollei NIES-4236]
MAAFKAKAESTMVVVAAPQLIEHTYRIDWFVSLFSKKSSFNLRGDLSLASVRQLSPVNFRFQILNLKSKI